MVQAKEIDTNAAKLEAQPYWSLARRIAFRCSFLYFVLFFLTGQEVGQIPYSFKLVMKYNAFWRHNVVWVAKYILRLPYDLTVFTNGSGDTTYNWVLILCYLILAAVGTLIWSILDRRRIGYAR